MLVGCRWTFTIIMLFGSTVGSTVVEIECWEWWWRMSTVQQIHRLFKEFSGRGGGVKEGGHWSEMLRVKGNKGKNDWWGGQSAPSANFLLFLWVVLPFSKDSQHSINVLKFLGKLKNFWFLGGQMAIFVDCWEISFNRDNNVRDARNCQNFYSNV
jgi:hypothetical protein